MAWGKPWPLVGPLSVLGLTVAWLTFGPPDSTASYAAGLNLGRRAELRPFYDTLPYKRRWVRLNALTWWEVGRETLLSPPAKKRPATPPPPAAARSAAIKALLEATHAPLPYVAAEAALALGRSRATEAFSRLQELTEDDRDRVRAFAWVAIGLLRTDDARRYLLSERRLKGQDLVARIVALGMLDRADEEVQRFLVSRVETPALLEEQRVALWALRIHHLQGVEALFSRIGRDTPSPAVLEQAILGAPLGEEPDAAFLDEVLRAVPPTWSSLNAVKAVKQIPAIDSGRLYELRINQAAAAIALRRLDPLPERTLRHLRASAGLHPDGKAHIPPGYYPVSSESMLTLAARANPEDGSFLLRVLSGAAYGRKTDKADGFTGEEVRNDPMRSLAAGALGLWLRRGGGNADLGPEATDDPLGFTMKAVEEAGGAEGSKGEPSPRDRGRKPEATERADGRRAPRALASRLRSESETPEVRASCALGLGLIGDPAAADDLAEALAALRGGEGDPLVAGYALLGLGLLRDSRTLGLAQRQLGSGPPPSAERMAKATMRGLTPDTDPDEEYARLGRRAALLGLAVLGDPAAAPILRGQWGADYWVSLEAAHAMRACGIHESIEGRAALVTLDNPGLACCAAASLGVLLDPDQPSRLDRLLDGFILDQPMLPWGFRPAAAEPHPTDHLGVRGYSVATSLYPGMARPFLCYYQASEFYEWGRAGGEIWR